MWWFLTFCLPTPVIFSPAEARIEDCLSTHVRWGLWKWCCSSASGTCPYCSVPSMNWAFHKAATDRSFGRENRLVVVQAWLRTHWSHYGTVSFLFRFLSCLFCSIMAERRVYFLCKRMQFKNSHKTHLQLLEKMWEQSILATLLIFSSSYYLFSSLSFTSLLHSLAPFPSRLLISPLYLPCSLLFFIIAPALSFFTSLSKEPDVFLVWFIQMQRLGLRECAAGRMHSAWVQTVEYTSYPHSWCKWVFLIYVSHAVYFFFFLAEEIASSVWIWHNFPAFAGLCRKKANNAVTKVMVKLRKLTFTHGDVNILFLT